MTAPTRPRAILYVDGFNLYYGALRRTPYKWLNPLTLAQLTYRNFDFVAVRYCSAVVSARPNDPQQPIIRTPIESRSMRDEIRPEGE